MSTLVPNVINAQDSIVLSICKFQSGETYNVIPDYADISGTIRIFEKKSYNILVENIKKVV